MQHRRRVDLAKENIRCGGVFGHDRVAVVRAVVVDMLGGLLERLDDADRSRVEQRLEEDASFRSARDRLDGVLRPLDRWSVASAPPLR